MYSVHKSQASECIHCERLVSLEIWAAKKEKGCWVKELKYQSPVGLA